ncbi:hypothetical protein L6164_000374 [Bauhinia variegata]|uniref:Uncharacterized protein n=1 Tax=Bauhinia variegata TaxID=167791 RepID=A0ACB9Q8E6_BAUVA|nr:hypothetical protein L6164_000374 [Bauhinia variegata]
MRAFDMTDRFFHKYLKLVDTDATMFFHSNAVMEWFVLRIEGLQNLTLFTVAALFVLLPNGYICPAEPPAIVEDNRPPSSWPSKGKLVEYDEPTKLLETNSSFSKLVAEYWASCSGNSSQNINQQRHQ